MISAPAEKHLLWQRLPFGWIEFRSFGDETPGQWLDRYLASGDGWLPEEAREAIERGFQAGVALFAGTGFASAGVAIITGERPAVNFLCTNVVLGDSPDAVSLHRLLSVLRFGGDDSTAETFTTHDGRTGTISSGVLTEGGMSVALTIGEVRLPEEIGSVIVMGMCTDPLQRTQIEVLTAFTLSMTQYLPEGVEPVLPDGLSEIPPEELGRRLLDDLVQQRAESHASEAADKAP